MRIRDGKQAEVYHIENVLSDYENFHERLIFSDQLYFRGVRTWGTFIILGQIRGCGIGISFSMGDRDLINLPKKLPLIFMGYCKVTQGALLKSSGM